MPPDGFDALLAFSERIGHDPALVQAAGGNTSLKSGDVLWIKASGGQPPLGGPV
jgi:rhamnose utilization protein RhaD (predicted bifunctional aldolase and dehydrogenase)